MVKVFGWVGWMCWWVVELEWVVGWGWIRAWLVGQGASASGQGVLWDKRINLVMRMNSFYIIINSLWE